MDTNYQEVKATDHAETVHVGLQSERCKASMTSCVITLGLSDPLSVNKQNCSDDW